MDGEGNLHAAEIGITWEGNETFLHGVMVVGPHFPRPAGPGAIMSTPYPWENEDGRSNLSTTAQPSTPVTPPKSLNWPAWFRHFRTVADVHGWNKDHRERYNWCPTSTKPP